jgi:hypothetical protein
VPRPLPRTDRVPCLRAASRSPRTAPSPPQQSTFVGDEVEDPGLVGGLRRAGGCSW